MFSVCSSWFLFCLTVGSRGRRKLAECVIECTAALAAVGTVAGSGCRMRYQELEAHSGRLTIGGNVSKVKRRGAGAT